MEKKPRKTKAESEVKEVKAEKTPARISGNHMVDFLPNGNFLPLGVEKLKVTADIAQVLIDKNYGKLV
jgi:hypothetical protein